MFIICTTCDTKKDESEFNSRKSWVCNDCRVKPKKVTKDKWRNRPGWQTARKQALERDGNCCTNCGSTEKLEVHHIIPFSEGGLDDLDNLLTLCKKNGCHQKFH